MGPRHVRLPVLLSCALAVAGHAQGTHSVPSLAGIPGVEVVVEELSPGLRQLGLSELTLRTDVELRLRRAGIAVVGQAQACDTLPCVYVHVTATIGSSLSAYFVHVGLQQMVSLNANPSASFSVETWHALGRIGLAARSQLADRLLDAVRGEVAQFTNAYHNANARN